MAYFVISGIKITDSLRNGQFIFEMKNCRYIFILKFLTHVEYLESQFLALNSEIQVKLAYFVIKEIQKLTK